VGKVCGTYGRREECIQDLVRRLKGTRALSRPWRRWENNINMDFKKMYDGAGPGLIWLRTGLVTLLCEQGHIISGFIKCGEFLDWSRNC